MIIDETKTPGRCFDMREQLEPRRITNAMWDYSWLRGHYPGGPFEDWDRALDDLLKRRFNTVRIDAYPHIVGREGATRYFQPAAPLLNWGFSTVDCEHDCAAALVEFVGKCQQRGIWVILSTWSAKEVDIPEDATGEARFQPLWTAWERTLDLLAEHDLLGSILYVDFDQEFPYFSNLQPLLATLGQAETKVPLGDDEAMAAAGQRDGSGAQLAWNPAQMKLVSEYFSSTCRHFQIRYPALRFTFSLTGFWHEVRAMNLKVFDVLELHIWMHSPRFDERTGFNRITKNRGAHDYKDYMRRISETFQSMRPMCMQAMHNQMRDAQAWSREIAAPLITTEAWGPWWHMDHPDLDWSWLRDWCETCMAASPDYDFWGITPWNFSHPYWSHWEDVAWYERVNQRFLESV